MIGAFVKMYMKTSASSPMAESRSNTIEAPVVESKMTEPTEEQRAEVWRHDVIKNAAFEHGRRQGVAEGMERAAGIADGCEFPMHDWAPGSFYATVRRDVGNCIRAESAKLKGKDNG